MGLRGREEREEGLLPWEEKDENWKKGRKRETRERGMEERLQPQEAQESRKLEMRPLPLLRERREGLGGQRKWGDTGGRWSQDL